MHLKNRYYHNNNQVFSFLIEQSFALQPFLSTFALIYYWYSVLCSPPTTLIVPFLCARNYFLIMFVSINKEALHLLCGTSLLLFYIVHSLFHIPPIKVEEFWPFSSLEYKVYIVYRTLWSCQWRCNLLPVFPATCCRYLNCR